MDRPRVWYAINEADTLVEASDGYFDFAGQNEFPGAELGLGRSLWDSVSDRTTRIVQMSLVRRVRRSGRTLALPFRCEQRPHQPLLELGRPRGDRTITMCSWCDRFEVGHTWMEVEEAVSMLGLTGGCELPAIGYALCDRCGGILERA
jgi:hypothetical protein